MGGNRPLQLCSKESVARWLIAYGARLQLGNHAKKTCSEKWGTALDKYTSYLSTLQVTDCKIQARVAENNMWFDDKLSNACLLCGNHFTVWSRRHHCRCCGLLVCQPCSLRKLQFHKGAKDGKPSLERACDKCFNRNHSRFLRSKNYNFKNKKFSMPPREFYKMQIMEATKTGSYAKYIKEREGVDEEVDGAEEEKKSEHANNNGAVSNGNTNGNGNGKGAKHTLSASVGGMFKSKKKEKHDAAHSEAHAQVNEAVSKVKQRGKKLANLADRSDQMRDNAQNFNDLAKQLANKKW